MTGECSRSSALRVSAMALRTASCIRGGSHGPYHIRGMNPLMMMEVWMTYAQSDVEMMNNRKICTSKAHPM
jgi:hypothetical protein